VGNRGRGDEAELNDVAIMRAGRVLLLVALIVVVLSIGWTVKPVRERIWDWIRRSYGSKEPGA
jgi:hypothetical protein